MTISNTPRYALLSVSDKSGLAEFAQQLVTHGYQLISTGGTAKHLKATGLKVIAIQDYTGFPEIMGGRVKTLHPKIYAGLLGRPGVDDAIVQAHDMALIQLVVVNLYPFAQVTAQEGCTFANAIENIDIGGPTMLRAAAKNHAHVGVVVDPADYDDVTEALGQHDGLLPDALRLQLAHKVFTHTAGYDAHISSYLSTHTQDAAEQGPALPTQLSLHWQRHHELRYGENPQQKAAVYAPTTPPAHTLAGATQHQGKALSYNNLADSDAALSCVRNLAQPACAIIKHANPCGLAVNNDITAAYQRAWQTDSTSAFGGILAFNRPVDAKTAQAIRDQQYAEVILAPEFSADALAIFADKPNIRLLSLTERAFAAPTTSQLGLHPIDGGVLVQTADDGSPDSSTWTQGSKRVASDTERLDLAFAWHTVKWVKSNAIVLVKDQATVGIGAGQMSRVDSLKIALRKAEEAGLDVQGAVLASDAFFPFSDCVEIAAKAGITAVVQPGGSIRDAEVGAAADTLALAMMLTGTRHFRH